MDEIARFDDILLAPLSQGTEILVPPAWGQGRALFGGLVAPLTLGVPTALFWPLAGKPSRFSPDEYLRNLHANDV